MLRKESIPPNTDPELIRSHINEQDSLEGAFFLRGVLINNRIFPHQSYYQRRGPATKANHGSLSICDSSDPESLLTLRIL